MVDIIVIGAGLTGLNAADRASAAGARVAVVEPSPLFGGLVANVEQVEDYPGRLSASGIEIASDLLDQLMQRNVQLLETAAATLTPTTQGFAVRTDTGTEVMAPAVICASGARLRSLDVPGAASFHGRGVSQCADCDGPLFQDEDVAVVGGGDAAATEALVLAGFCRGVTILCRGASRMRPALRARLDAAGNIVIREGVQVLEVGGGQTVERLRLRDGGGEADIAVTGVFPFIGLEPNAAFLPAAVRDAAGCAVANAQGATAIPGLFAVGAVRQGYSGRLEDAVREAHAAADAARAHAGRG